MRKLIEGIVEFRRNVQQSYRENFGRLAIGQSPDTLFIACSDSRVVPNTFASTNPGDLFVIRNVGNLIPPCGKKGASVADESEAAAIEFSILNLNIKDIIVCGHSECGAMRALVDKKERLDTPNFKSWLKYGKNSLASLKGGQSLDTSLSEHNQLSQLNVLQQIENVKSYPIVRERLDAGKLSIHAWWFDIAKADVYALDSDINKFVLIDENHAEKLLSRIN